MKKLIALMIVLAIPVLASSSPFLVCDPQAGVTHYKMTGASWVPVSVPAQEDGSLKMDVASASVGAASLTVRACVNDPVWGEACSDAVPFGFTRPAAPSTMKGLKLSP